MESSSTPDNFPAQIDQSPGTNQNQKFLAFDFLRAIFAIAVVGYKTDIFYIPKLLIPNAFTVWLSDYFLSGMVGALAVPVFLQISLFLFNLKNRDIGFGYFLRKRLPRLVSLYVFWVGLFTLYDLLFIDKLAVIDDAIGSVKKFILFIVSGNNSIYFFFFSLIFVTVISQGLITLLNKIKQPALRLQINYLLLILTAVLVFSFAALKPVIDYMGWQSSFWKNLNGLIVWDYNPLNFLPYVFTAAITTQEYNEGKLIKMTQSLKQKLFYLAGLTLLFFVLEWVLTSNQILIQVDQAPLDHYMRLSLLFGSWLLLYLALLFKGTVPVSIQFLSACSLGIYCFNSFFALYKPQNAPFLSGLQGFPALQNLVGFIVALVGSIALTLLCQRSRALKRFV